MIGKIFNGRYEIIEKLGSGGTAIVYKGLDTLLGRMITVKILREEFANDEEFVRRFRREAQAVACLSHGNIVAVYDVGYEDNMHYIVMEFVEGQSLKAHIKERGALPIHEAVMIMNQILEGIEYAHEHGLIHRDIKPHNILLGLDGRAKVTDFGIAVGMDDVTQTYSTTSRIMGSVHYISPEQVQGHPVTEKSDIYSAGIVFYEMLTGQLPFSGDTPITIAMQHVQGELTLPYQINPDIPIGLSYVVMRSLRKNPAARYDTAKEMKTAIATVSEGLSSMFDMMDEESHPRHERMPRGTREERAGKTQNPKGQKKKLKVGMVVIIVFAFILLLSAGWLISQAINAGKNSKEVEVPNMVGWTIEEAEAMLAQMNLPCEITLRNDNEIPEGEVISQTPKGGQMVKAARKEPIILVVSEGIRKVEMPYLLGMTLKEAQIILNNNDLLYELIEKNDDEIPAGEIIGQIPEKGEIISAGETIALTVNLGKKAKIIKMPNLVGMSLNEARTTLEGLDLLIDDIKYEESNEYYSNIVISQSVAKDADIQEGSYVAILISSGPGPTARQATVRYTVPMDGMNHDIKIVVEDSTGTREVYNQTDAPGTMISEIITYYNKGKVDIYMDGELVYSQNV
ncbi:MAG: Stk1 family PASTA domain-containing Ser/Thr kinase [Clostridiales bacterium]|nr:Stk1 family PASTA domain-containing Ser/Thr kinase [Clostridiales bacterium]